MVHGLAEQSGGFLDLKSAPGKGTTAEIWLPVAASEGDVAPILPDAVEQPRQSLKILAVDDDSLVLMNTVAMLEELGHTVIEAHSGLEALEILHREPVDLLITDQGMPKMTGGELAARTHASQPDLPIIVATGYAELSDEKARSLLRLPKPFSTEELAAVIAKAVA